jgi:hypothetical protein
MKAKIKPNGCLQVERADTMKPQECPFSSNGEDAYCGDWCPLFDEQQVEDIVDCVVSPTTGKLETRRTYYLIVALRCSRGQTLKVDTDERPRP